MLRSVCMLAFFASITASALAQDIGPAPGRLIDVGGRRLHVYCTGSGSPTVILESGASSFAIDWHFVQPEIAKTNRVCSYDRAGSGWSDPRTDVETAARVVADLHRGLMAAGERAPYVMVGASRGGIFVRSYQLEYPQEVIGLVLVDPATETRLFTLVQNRATLIASLTAEQLRATLPTGPMPIPTREPQTGPPFDRLPPVVYQQRIEIDRKLIRSFPPTVSAEIVWESAEGERASMAALLASRRSPTNPMRRVPVVVLTRGEGGSPEFVQNAAELARLSDNSRHTIVAGSGHEIHLFAPAVVVQAIQDVAQAAAQNSRLLSR